MALPKEQLSILTFFSEIINETLTRFSVESSGLKLLSPTDLHVLFTK